MPLDETLSAVQVAVLAGKVRYAGLVAPQGWQLATVAERARALGNITLPASAQVEYSLLARAVETELLPAARHHGVGLLAWAPLGRGVLTGKYADGTPADSRAASPALAPYVEARRNERSARIVQAVLTAADGLGTSPLAVALAWVRDRPGVASAVVGRPGRRAAGRVDGHRVGDAARRDPLRAGRRERDRHGVSRRSRRTDPGRGPRPRLSCTAIHPPFTHPQGGRRAGGR